MTKQPATPSRGRNPSAVLCCVFSALLLLFIFLFSVLVPEAVVYTGCCRVPDMIDLSIISVLAQWGAKCAFVCNTSKYSACLFTVCYSRCYGLVNQNLLLAAVFCTVILHIIAPMFFFFAAIRYPMCRANTSGEGTLTPWPMALFQ